MMPRGVQRAEKSSSWTVETSFPGLRMVIEIVPRGVIGGRMAVKRWPSGSVVSTMGWAASKSLLRSVPARIPIASSAAKVNSGTSRQDHVPRCSMPTLPGSWMTISVVSECRRGSAIGSSRCRSVASPGVIPGCFQAIAVREINRLGDPKRDQRPRILGHDRRQIDRRLEDLAGQLIRAVKAQIGVAAFGDVGLNDLQSGPGQVEQHGAREPLEQASVQGAMNAGLAKIIGNGLAG